MRIIFTNVKNQIFERSDEEENLLTREIDIKTDIFDLNNKLMGLLDFRQVFLLLLLVLLAFYYKYYYNLLIQLLSQILLQLLLQTTTTNTITTTTHQQIFLVRDRLPRTTPLIWPPYTNLLLPGQASQDHATPLASIHKSSSSGTGLSGPRYSYGHHTQIFISRNRPFRTTLFLWPPYTNLPLAGQDFQDHATLMAPIHKSRAQICQA